MLALGEVAVAWTWLQACQDSVFKVAATRAIETMVRGNGAFLFHASLACTRAGEPNIVQSGISLSVPEHENARDAAAAARGGGGGMKAVAACRALAALIAS